MLESILILTSLAFIFSACATGRSINGGEKFTSKIPMSPHVRLGKLSNGLTYYIRQNKKPVQKAELRLVVNIGSILEDNDQLGLAHFMEHMSFNGTRSFPKNQLISYLQSIGVSFGGDLNAYTDFDETVYTLPVPTTNAEVVDKGFTILQEWAKHASLRKEDIESERGVVLEEYRSGLGADERMRVKYFPRLLNGSRYAERLPIGTEQSLKNFSHDALRRFYKDWYRPDLMAVVVVGDVDPIGIERKIRERFSELVNPTDERQRPPLTEIPERKKTDVMVLTDPEAPVTRVEILSNVRPIKIMTTEADYRTYIAEQMFDTVFAERLARLTEQAEPPYLIAIAGKERLVKGYESYNANAVCATPDPERAVRAILTEMERVKRYGFNPAEFDRARRQSIERYETYFKEKDKMESSDLASELVDHFVYAEPAPGIDWEHSFIKKHLDGIALEEVNGLKGMMGTNLNEMFILVTAPSNIAGQLPTESAILTLVSEVAKSKIDPLPAEDLGGSLFEQEPVAGTIVKEEKFYNPNFTELTYSNGVKVTVMPTDFKNNEIVCKSVRFGGQYLYDIADKGNVENLTSTISSQGYGRFSQKALNRFLSGRKAQSNLLFEEYTEEVIGDTRPEDIDIFLQSIFLKFTRPRRDETLLRATINQQKGLFAGFLNDPDVVYEDTMNSVVAQNHPRGKRIQRPEDFDKIDPERSQAIYHERFGNSYGWNFIFVGNIELEKARPLFAKYLGGLPGSPRELSYRDLGVRYPKGVVSRNVYIGKEQKSIVTIIYSGDADYRESEILKFNALVEVLETRTNDKIREELGSSYSPSVTGSIEKIPTAHYRLQFSVQCGPANVGKVVNAILDMVNKVKVNGVSDDELMKVKEIWKNDYRVEARTNEYWVESLADRYLYGLDIKAFSEYEARADRLTTADIKSTANSYLNNSNYIKLVLYPEKQERIGNRRK